MTRPCPVISVLAKPGAPSCTLTCCACTCADRIRDTIRPDREEPRDGRR